ncbi:alpha/beta hydrolase [Paenibacillus sp. 481]|uniref:alpha/beta hydrolase n=1 Tax=Paenibacillus sp. 481 TaxID=2835869 RepID=UPI001E61DB89|nr:alpha/beta hydrolase [Paenibacillus sp. 481]UHA72220.1 alpha/beta hydrolase [Paenibacillus sp. 481]
MSLNPTFKAILAKLEALQSRPLHLLTPEEARGHAKDPYSTRPVNPKLAGAERVTTSTIEGPFGPIPVRIYTPAGTGPFPVLVYFHGGGWVLGSLDGVDTICRRMTQLAKVVVVSVCYRLAPEHPFPVPVQEAMYVTQWVAEQAHSLQGDLNRIAVGGDSAGGNLAAAVTLMAKEQGGPALAAQLLIYPATNCMLQSDAYDQFATGYLVTRHAMEWFQNHYLPKPEDALNPLASPLLCDDMQGLPPAYIVTAQCDPLRDDGEQYAQRLQEAGVSVTLQRYEGMIHDFMSFADPPWEMEEALAAIDETAVAFKRYIYNDDPRSI